MDLNIGNIIKKLRTERSMTQEELAEHLGISFQAVSKRMAGWFLRNDRMASRKWRRLA